MTACNCSDTEKRRCGKMPLHMISDCLVTDGARQTASQNWSSSNSYLLILELESVLLQFLPVICKINSEVHFEAGQCQCMQRCETINLRAWNFRKCSFTIRFMNKFVVKWSLNNPPYLKGVATLPCDL